MLYLKIENPGLAPTEAFTTLGASTKTDIHDVPGLIGRFGSGANLGTLTLLREGLNPVIFTGTLRLEFSTKPITVSASGRSVDHQRVQVRYGGRDHEGRSRSGTEDLGWVLAYGANDWQECDLALREYVSNAIDACLLTGTTLLDIRKVVKVEIVGDNQVRAKTGHTRIFVPVTPEVQRWFNNLGRWFLHFSEPSLLGQAILPKNGRNISWEEGEPNQRAVIYRRGVRVREFTSDSTRSLFDYNLEDLQMDESRQVDDWRVMNEVGRCLKKADRKVLASILQTMAAGQVVWEQKLSSYGLAPTWDDSEEIRGDWKKEWQAALEVVAGSDGVFVSDEADVVAELVQRKGFTPLQVPSSWLDAAKKLGVMTDASVVSEDDKRCREYFPPTPALTTSLDRMWKRLEALNMTQGKQKPPAKVFYEPLRGESQTWGLYKDGTVMLHQEIANEANELHWWVLLEEVSHHITGATDLSRDFQTFLVRLAAMLLAGR